MQWTNLFEVRECSCHQYLSTMACVVPNWDQTGKHELDDITVQSQGKDGFAGHAGTDMPAANRAEMQAECGKALLIHIRSNTEEKKLLLRHQSYNRIPKVKPSKVLSQCSRASKHGWKMCCLIKSSWDLSMSRAPNEHSVMDPFCLDEKHHWDLNETPGEVQERAPWYNKGNVLLALWEFGSLVFLIDF